MNVAVNSATDKDGKPFPMTPAEIAWVCHEANRAYCLTQGDESQPAWEDAPSWQRSSAVNGVLAIIANPNRTPKESHEGWYKEKFDAGWVYGEVKNPDSDPPTHPCMLPYDKLPLFQRRKDSIFGAVVRACRAED